MKIVKGSRVQLVCEVFVLKLPLKTNSFRVSHYLLHNGELKLQICWKIYIGLFLTTKPLLKHATFMGVLSIKVWFVYPFFAAMKKGIVSYFYNFLPPLFAIKRLLY